MLFDFERGVIGYTLGMLAVGGGTWVDANVAMPIFSVPAAVIGAAAFGTAASLSTGDPVHSRRELFGQSLSIIFGTAAAAFMARGGPDWMSEVQGPIASVVAYLARHVAPSITERSKEIIRNFKFSLRRKGDDDRG